MTIASGSNALVALTCLTSVVAQPRLHPDPDFDSSVKRPAYHKDGPRVLFDEAHFNTHTAGGRYKPFVDLIRNDGYVVTPSREPLSGDILRGYSILVIAGANGGPDLPAMSKPAFTNAECADVERWVRSGGALLLISDHFPNSAAAANLARSFGVTMHAGGVIDPVEYDRSSGNQGFLLFTRENGLLRPHAITDGRERSERIGKIETWTGTSMTVPPTGAGLLLLSKNALLTEKDKPNAPATGQTQALAMNHGKGRIVILGEASMLTAQAMMEPGKPPISRSGMSAAGFDNRQMTLNILHWLSGLLK